MYVFKTLRTLALILTLAWVMIRVQNPLMAFRLGVDDVAALYCFVAVVAAHALDFFTSERLPASLAEIKARAGYLHKTW